MLVLIYLPRKDGKLSWLRRKRRSHKYSNLGRARIELGTLWSEGRDLTNCTNHARQYSKPHFYSISFLFQVTKLQAAIKYGEEDLQGAKVCLWFSRGVLLNFNLSSFLVPTILAPPLRFTCDFLWVPFLVLTSAPLSYFPTTVKVCFWLYMATPLNCNLYPLSLPSFHQNH